MFEPHEDRRESTTLARGRITGFLGFVLGFGVGWLVWFLLVRPALQSTPTAENPSGHSADWIYFGSLLVSVVLVLFIVAVIGEWIGGRRRKE